MQAKDAQSETEHKQVEKEVKRSEDVQKEAQKLAESLGESDDKPIKQITQLIETCGIEFVKKISEETDNIELKGGLKTYDNKHRRTKGGVFFLLAKEQMDATLRQEIFPNSTENSSGGFTPSGIEWAERVRYLKPLLSDPGKVNNLTVTLIGRPGKVHIEGGTVMTAIVQSNIKAPPYPKGVPLFESVEKTTCYYVFMSLKHWKKVKTALEDTTDMLIVEGTSVFDPEIGGICLLTTRVSTKGLERKKYLTSIQRTKGEKANNHGKLKSSDRSKLKGSANNAKPQIDLSRVPSSVSDKLNQLNIAADTLRQKIDIMEAKDQKTGLDMTRRLLEQTEKQIVALVKRYEK
jgi:hypothetical protein